LIPWAFYAFFTMWFFVQALKDESNGFITIGLGLFCLVGLVY
jgi:hypothetical protein